MKITFFSPHVSIVPHFSAEMRLARILGVPKENNIEFLTCGSFFAKDCTISRYLGLTLPNSKEMNPIACLNCDKVTKIANLEKKFHNRQLTEFFTESDKTVFDNCHEALIRDPINFSHNDISFGRIAAYELILEFKKSNLVFDKHQLQTLINFVENSFRTYLAAKRYLSTHKPDRVVIFNAQYGVGASFARAAAEEDIRVDVLSFSNMISEMQQYIRLWDWEYYKNLNPSRIEWQGESFTSSNFEKFRIARNFRIIRKATSPWTYSTPASNLKIREFFEIPQERIIILAIMSSLDEQFAARVSNIIPETFASTKVFKNQEDWIHNLAEFLKTFKNVVLVVRPHPREVSNKREKILAEIVKSRFEFFANLPQGVIVDYPELGVPIESYFAEVVGVTTGWSSVGIDWQMRGKMCVSYDAALPLYPPGTHLSGNTKEDYFANIEKVIKGLVNNSDYYTGNALSWYVFSNFKGTARLGSSILNEVYLSEILRKTKFLSLITRFFPKFRLWLDLHSISLFPNKKKILEYFSSSKKSFLSNI